MRGVFLGVACFLTLAPGVRAEDPPRLRVSAAAGPSYGGAAPGLHLGVSGDYALTRHLMVGLDLSLSDLPHGIQPIQGGFALHEDKTTLWGLATLRASAFPSARVSPYLLAGYGLGEYRERGSSDAGRALLLGVGLDVRVGPRTTVFAEGRIALMEGIAAADGLHAENPVRVGVRLGF